MVYTVTFNKALGENNFFLAKILGYIAMGQNPKKDNRRPHGTPGGSCGWPPSPVVYVN